MSSEVLSEDSESPIVYCGLTNAGIVRTENQDSIHFLHPDQEIAAKWGTLYAVADGLGGYEHGNVASGLAIKIFFETFYQGEAGQSPKNMRAGIRDANMGVYEAAQRMKARMGTTLTAVNILGDTMHIAHVGDSRAYLVRNGTAACLTNDHSRVGEMVRAKLITPEKARTHNQRSVLNRCLGMELFVQPDMLTTKLRVGDQIVLCSDGVWSVIQDEEFGQIASEGADGGVICERLLNLAMERESDDNVSAIAIRVNSLRAGHPSGAESGGLRRLFPFLRSKSSGESV